ncbi:hypothetical protein P8452_00326 [Trifolium repens]|nr:hypothetical protein P8452_00326 [Trifolium repens]
MVTQLYVTVRINAVRLESANVKPNGHDAVKLIIRWRIDSSLWLPQMITSKSSLQWLIQKLQDRIILSTLRRRLVVNDANKSRYSLEYLEKDETIVAHLVKGIDAYIKLSHDWPIFGSPLKLISIKGLDILKKSSASFHCEVEVREFYRVSYKKFQT